MNAVYRRILEQSGVRLLSLGIILFIVCLGTWWFGIYQPVARVIERKERALTALLDEITVLRQTERELKRIMPKGVAYAPPVPIQKQTVAEGQAVLGLITEYALEVGLYLQSCRSAKEKETQVIYFTGKGSLEALILLCEKVMRAPCALICKNIEMVRSADTNNISLVFQAV